MGQDDGLQTRLPRAAHQLTFRGEGSGKIHMSEKLPFDGTVEGLLVHLNRLVMGAAKPGSGQMLTHAQAVALLAMSDDLRIDESRRQGTSTWIAEKIRYGLLTEVPSGETRTHELSPFFVIRSIKVNGNSSDQDRYADARQKRFEHYSSGSSPESAVKPPSSTYELPLLDLGQVLPLLKASTYWTGPVRLFLGVESLTVATVPAKLSTVSADSVVDPVQVRASQVRESYSHLDLTEDQLLTKSELDLLIIGAGCLKRDGHDSKVSSAVKNTKPGGHDHKQNKRGKKGKEDAYSLVGVVNGLIEDRYSAHYVPSTPKVVQKKGTKGAAQ